MKHYTKAKNLAKNVSGVLMVRNKKIKKLHIMMKLTLYQQITNLYLGKKYKSKRRTTGI